MPGANATITFAGDDQALLKAFQRQERSIERLKQKLRESGKAGGRAGQETAAGASRAAGKIREFIGAVAGVGSVVGGVAAAARAVRQELEMIQQRQETARVEASTFAEQLRGVRINFVPDETLTDQMLEPTIQREAAAVRTDPKLFAAALSEALSAKGSLPGQTAVEAVREAFRLQPGDVESATQLAQRALDIAQQTGQQDVRAILGSLVQLQSQARLTRLPALGANAVPAITSLIQLGDQFEESAEIFATINKLMKDAEGRLSRTATIALGAQLGEFVPEAEAKDKRGEFRVPEEQRRAFEGAQTTLQRIEVLQQAPELRRAFMAQASFEKVALGSIRALLEGQPEALRELTSIRENVSALGPELSRVFEEKVATLEGGRFQSTLTAQQETAENIRGFQLGATSAQRTAVARKVLDETLGAINLKGFDFFEKLGLTKAFEATIATGAEARVPELVAARQLRIEREAFEKGGVTAEERPSVALLEKNIELLEGLALQRAQESPEISRAASDFLESTITNQQQGFRQREFAGAAPEELSERREQIAEIKGLREDFRALLMQAKDQQQATEENTREVKRLRETQQAGQRQGAAAGALRNRTREPVAN